MCMLVCFINQANGYAVCGDSPTPHRVAFKLDGCISIVVFHKICN